MYTRPAPNQIKKHYLFLVENGQHRKAIALLRNIIIDKAYFELCLQLNKEAKEQLDQEIAPTEYRDIRDVQRTRLTSRLIRLGQDLPNDQTIVQDRITYELNNGKDFSEACRMVSLCYGISTANFARALNQRIDDFQEINLENAVNDDDVYEFSQVIDRAGKELSEHLEQATDFDGHDVTGFIGQFLSDQRFVPNFRQRAEPATGRISPYFADIQQQPDEVKRHLLLWEEQFLIGNYPAALEHAEAARVGELATTSLNYEYTLLAYLHTVKHDALVAEAVRGKNKNNFDYLLLLISRANQLEKPSSTLADTMGFIFQRLIGGLRKFYHNIDYTYLLDDSEKGRSRRRDYVKNIVQTYLQVIAAVPASGDADTFPEELLQELDGVRKYPWISISGGKLGNRTNLDAIALRRRLLELIAAQAPENSLEELYEQSRKTLDAYMVGGVVSPEDAALRRRKYREAHTVLNALYGSDAPISFQRSATEDTTVASVPEATDDAMEERAVPQWLREPLPLEATEPSFASTSEEANTIGVPAVPPFVSSDDAAPIRRYPWWLFLGLVVVLLGLLGLIRLSL